MPRGNDATAVAAENRKRFGDYQDCESLIRSQAALVNPALQRTLQIPRDDSKTDEIKKDLDAVAAKFNLGEGESVVDASVRGNAIVAVIEGTDGRWRKDVTGYDDDWQPPTLTEDERLQADRAKLEQSSQHAMKKIQEDADARLAAARAEADEEVAAKLREIEDEKVEKLKALEADTEPEAEPETKVEEPAETKPKFDLDSMSGADLDELAAKKKVKGYPKSKTVAERRAALEKALN